MHQNDLCESHPGVRSYSGYVHLPPGALNDTGVTQEYPINTFFWFFESRKDPENAPLAIWMNGGPGSSSMRGLLSGTGPCYVDSDSNSTTNNEWSWNNEANMLYLDQPVQVGFSYDTLNNATKSLEGGDITLLNDTVPAENATLMLGTYPSQNSSQTARGVRNAAKAAWSFMQTFTQEFPHYYPNDSRIAVTTESFGGRWGPEFAGYFEEQNMKIANGTLNASNGTAATPLNLDTLLIINGCADRLTMWPTYATMANNNTYGIKAINDSLIHGMQEVWEEPNGCKDQVLLCHEAARIHDPANLGDNDAVNEICEAAETFCYTHIMDSYRNATERTYFDIGQFAPTTKPSSFWMGFLDQAHVHEALGVPLNFTSSSDAVGEIFDTLGMYPRDASLGDMAYLLDHGVKVTLMYGDRDFACNWYGGEQVSLAIPHAENASFKAAGYTPLRTNDSYIGGQTRQHGNLSFSRVYQAGHEVPGYQPETAYKVFMRALTGRDIATGEIEVDADYSTSGPSNTYNITNESPELRSPSFCYTPQLGSCSDQQVAAVRNGSATICDYIVKDSNSTQLFPEIVGSLNATGCGTGGR